MRALLLLVMFATTACARRPTGRPAAPPAETGELPFGSAADADTLLADVGALAPAILVRLRYATADNFTGAPLPGYEGNRAMLRREAARALADVARDVADSGWTLEIWDAYRPVRATDAMVAWTARTGRPDLVRDGYIASRSRHNLGVAIDLTLVDRASGRELDMGTPFDTFAPAAHVASATGAAAANRQRLRRAMTRHGFAPYEEEWWHFSFPIDHPLRFDVPVR